MAAFDEKMLGRTGREELLAMLRVERTRLDTLMEAANVLADSGKRKDEEIALLTIALTTVQARCTELLNESRLWKRLILAYEAHVVDREGVNFIMHWEEELIERLRKAGSETAAADLAELIKLLETYA